MVVKMEKRGEKSGKIETGKRWIVYAEKTTYNPAFGKNTVELLYIGSFADYETAKAEAEEHGGFIVEDDPKRAYREFRKKAKALAEKRSEKARKDAFGRIRGKMEKYGLKRAVFKLSRNIPEFWVVYYPDYPSFDPEKAEKALFDRVTKLKSVNAKTGTVAVQIKVKRAKIPLIAEKVRKDELIYLSKTGKALIGLKELEKA
ncbi:MAG: hypothetical protein GXO43_02300 [Crenarchaeota archaeon]|nr:hypothetical protein [Thermoproteota archaeon]